MASADKMNIDDDVWPNNRMNIDDEPVPNIPLRKRSIKPKPNTRRLRREKASRRTQKRRTSHLARTRALTILQQQRQDFAVHLPKMMGASIPLQDVFGALISSNSVVAVHEGGQILIKAYASFQDFLHNRPTPGWKSMLDHSSLSRPLAIRYTLYVYWIPPQTRVATRPRSPLLHILPQPRPQTPPPRPQTPPPRPQTPPPRTSPVQAKAAAQPVVLTPLALPPAPQTRSSPRLPVQEFHTDNPEELLDPLNMNVIQTGSILVYFLDTAGRSFEDKFIVAYESDADRKAGKPTSTWDYCLKRNTVPFYNAPLNRDALEFRVARVSKKKAKASLRDFPVHVFEKSAEDGFLRDLQTGQILVYFADAEGRTFLGQSIVAFASMDDFLKGKETAEFKHVLETGRHPFLRKTMPVEDMNMLLCKVQIGHRTLSVKSSEHFVTAKQSPATPLSAFVTPVSVKHKKA